MLKAIKLKKYLPLIVIGCAILLFLLFLVTKSHTKPAPVAERTWSVAAKKITPQTLTPNLVLFGKVESEENTTLKAAITADVIATPIDEGNSVYEKQTLVQLDPRDAQLTTQQRQAEIQRLNALIASEKTRHAIDLQSLESEQRLIQLSKNELERRRQLEKKQAGTKAEFEQAEQAYQQQRLDLYNKELAVNDFKNRIAELQAQKRRAEAELGVAKLDLERATIIAPYAARVATVHVSVGDRVQPGDQLVEIFDNHALEIRAQIPFKYVDSIRDALSNNKKPKAKIELDEHIIYLTLDRLTAKISSGRSGVDAIFKVDNEMNLLELEKTVTIYLSLPAKNAAIALPSQALYELDRIYKIVEGRLLAVKVKKVGSYTTMHDEKLIIVTSTQLKSGDLILLTHIPNAITGLKVRIVKM